MLKLYKVSTEQEFFLLEEPWKALVHKLGVNPFLSWEWMSAWWIAYAPHVKGELAVLVWENESEVVAILPLYIQCLEPFRLKTLRFIGTGELSGSQAYPEFLDLIVDPEFLQDCAEDISRILSKQSSLLSFDEFDTGILSTNSHLSILIESLPVRRRGILISKHWKCYYADLQNGYEDYLKKLSLSMQKRIKRLLKEVAGITFQFPEDKREAFITHTRWHQNFWVRKGKAGAYQGETALAFHSRIVESVPMTFVEFQKNATPIAFLYGFRVQDTFLYYQASRVERTDISSLGILAHVLLLKDLSEKGYKRYSFLAGEEDFKRQLSTEYELLVRHHLYQPSLMLFASLALRKLCRVI